MRKNRLIALIGTLTMAAAGLAAVSAGVSSKKAESVSAASKVDKDCYTFYVIDQVYATNDGRDLKIHMWDINIDSSMGFDSSNLRADFDNAGCINDFVRASLDSSSLTIDSYFDWQQDISTGKEWKLTIPWYVTSFKYKLYAGSYWATDGDQTMSTRSYYNIYLCNGTWNSWKTSVVKESYSSKDNVSQFAISAACTPSDAGSATVKGNGGSAVGSGNYFERQKITAKATANSGYAFSSWSDSGTAEHTFYASQDVALTANFIANSYTVALNANEGTGGPASVSATYGAAMPTLSSLPSRVGYTFAGYYDDASAGNQYYDKDGNSARNWDKASTATLYAHWTPNPKTAYIVNHYQQNTDLTTYTLHEYDNMSGPTASQTQAVAHSYSGFTSQSFSQTTIAADGSTVVDIYYDRNPYTMSYSLGEKPSGTAPTAVTMYYGCTPNECGVTLPDLSGTWEDHDFNGWKYLGQGQDLPITQTTPYAVAGPITITAQWSETPVSSHSVTFVKAEGQDSWGTISSSTGGNPISVEDGSEISVSSNTMTIDGKTITATPAEDSADGHYSYSFGSFSPNSGTISSDTTVTVNFSRTVKQYSLVWSFDGGSTEESYTAAGTYDWGTIITVPSNLNKEGFSCDGLFFDSEFTEPVSGNFNLVENTTVYAKFTGLKYNVSVGVDSECSGWGTVSSSAVSNVPYGSAINVNGNKITINGTEITATPTTDTVQYDYEFSGWTGYSSPVVSAQNIKAVFTRTLRQYTISWDANGGEITSDSSEYTHGLVNYGTTIVAPEVSNTGYELASWSPALGYDPIVTGNQQFVANYRVPAGQYIVGEFNGWAANATGVQMTTLEGAGEYDRVAYHVGANSDNDEIQMIWVSSSNDYTPEWKEALSVTYYNSPSGRCMAGTASNEQAGTISNKNAVLPMDAISSIYEDGLFTVKAYKDGDNAKDYGRHYALILEEYKLEFNMGGHGTAPGTDYALYNETFTQPEDPADVRGYEFNGWVDGEGNPFDFTAPVTANAVAYADWESVPVEVAINYVVDGETYATRTGNVGDTIPNVPEVPEKTGYHDGHWDKDLTVFPDADETTITAEYTINTYTINFYDDEGEIIKSDTVNYNVVPTCTDPTKEGTAQYSYTFTGWATEQGGEVVYEKGVALPNAIKNANYYAVFEESVNKYTVTIINSDERGDSYTHVLENIEYGTEYTFDTIESIFGDDFHDPLGRTYCGLKKVKESTTETPIKELTITENATYYACYAFDDASAYEYSFDGKTYYSFTSHNDCAGGELQSYNVDIASVTAGDKLYVRYDGVDVALSSDGNSNLNTAGKVNYTTDNVTLNLFLIYSDGKYSYKPVLSGMPQNAHFASIDGVLHSTTEQVHPMHADLKEYVTSEVEIAPNQTIDAYYNGYYTFIENYCDANFFKFEGGKVICLADQTLTYVIHIQETSSGNANAIYIELTPESQALLFAQEFLEKVSGECKIEKDAEGHDVVKTDIDKLTSAWSEMSEEYKSLSDDAKDILKKASANPESTLDLEKFASSYDYIYWKYGNTLKDYGGNFAERNVKVQSGSRQFSVSNVSTSTWIIAAVAVVGIAAVGVFFIYKKRKEN